MNFKLFFKKASTPNNREWKDKNKRYLKQLQIFLDVADNIEREDLKETVILEMLKCDRILTELAQKQIELVSKKNESNLK